jgi:BNR repeat-containing family member
LCPAQSLRPQAGRMRSTLREHYLMRTFLFTLGLICLSFLAACVSPRRPVLPSPLPSLTRMPETFHPIAAVWSGAPVNFDLLTYGNQQFVAFYDQKRFLTVGVRTLSSSTWTFKRLNDQFGGWDVHDYITMAVDDSGNLHVAGNMHAQPLKYWRTTLPFDIQTLVRQPCLVCADRATESQVTYPHFFRGPANEFLFSYRQGFSGKGGNYIDVYNQQTHTWHRFLPGPLFSYPNEYRPMSAYPLEFLRDTQGMYYAVWTWRDPGGAELTHDLSYARSKNLRTWERSNGTILSLPLTIDNTDIVDLVPVRGGLLNSAVAAGFDARDRLVISYHKYDSHGHSQIYNARLEDGIWRIYQTSHWTCRWNFGGGGALPHTPDWVAVGKVEVEDDGGLSQAYRSCDGESGRWRLDQTTLQPTGREYPRRSVVPAEVALIKPTVTQICGYTDVQIRTAFNRGNTDEARQSLLLWTTLGGNRDIPRRNCTDPEPTTLWLYQAPQSAHSSQSEEQKLTGLKNLEDRFSHLAR